MCEIRCVVVMFIVYFKDVLVFEFYLGCDVVVKLNVCMMWFVICDEGNVYGGFCFEGVVEE